MDEIKKVLHNLKFPVQKEDVVNHVKNKGAHESIITMLRDKLPDGTFNSVEEIISKLPLGNIGKGLKDVM